MVMVPPRRLPEKEWMIYERNGNGTTLKGTEQDVEGTVMIPLRHLPERKWTVCERNGNGTTPISV
jgi:hypothetical protein